MPFSFPDLVEAVSQALPRLGAVRQTCILRVRQPGGRHAGVVKRARRVGFTGSPVACDLQAAPIWPLAPPVHAVRLAGDIVGKTVANVPSGTIGLRVLATVKYRAARSVVVTDVPDSERLLALELGAGVFGRRRALRRRGAGMEEVG